MTDFSDLSRRGCENGWEDILGGIMRFSLFFFSVNRFLGVRARRGRNCGARIRGRDWMASGSQLCPVNCLWFRDLAGFRGNTAPCWQKYVYFFLRTAWYTLFLGLLWHLPSPFWVVSCRLSLSIAPLWGMLSLWVGSSGVCRFGQRAAYPVFGRVCSWSLSAPLSISGKVFLHAESDWALGLQQVKPSLFPFCSNTRQGWGQSHNTVGRAIAACIWLRFHLNPQHPLWSSTRNLNTEPWVRNLRGDSQTNK